MFTGIVEETGRLERVEPLADGRQLRIGAARVLEDLKIEDSIAVNGVCLTVVARDAAGFSVQAVRETLSKTTIGSLSAGAALNLERALTPSTRMGGHFVQGHVDCVGRVRSLTPADPGREVWITFPREFARYVVRTGSVAIEGVSLTVAAVEGDALKIALIPHTLDQTTLQGLAAGSALNLEFDCLAKYVEGVLAHGRPSGGLDEAALRRMGYGGDL